MQSESPILILSQDYELFFRRSGTVEKCLFEPCDALLKRARKLGLSITFFVDAGMILCMEQFAAASRSVSIMAGQIKKHIASLSAAGHEIALHVHPHWEDSVWRDGEWDFSKTRYRLRDFSTEEISHICASYSNCLAEISGQQPTAYRAGGFCVEPFSILKEPLSDVGIWIDSSVVPGALLKDKDKGFNFRDAPQDEWWFFNDSPTVASVDGQFLELPITSQQLPFFYYWQRLLTRMRSRAKSRRVGDGTSKTIGGREIFRRLSGMSRIAELSVDEPKANQLTSDCNSRNPRQLWHVMGHPKLVSRRSLERLEQFVDRVGIEKFETLTSVANCIRLGNIPGPRSRVS